MSTRRRGVVTPTLTRRDLWRTAGIGGGLAIAAAGGPILRLGSPAAAQDQVTLTFWLPGGSQTYCQMHNDVAADYSAEHPNISFNEIPCGAGTENYVQQLLAAIASGNPPDGTVLWDTPVSLAVRNALAPLDELMADSQYAKAENWPAGILSSCQFEGQTYGLPVTSGVYGIWYNREWFEEKGIPSTRDQFPKTWDELRQLSKEFTTWNGDRLETAGFVAPPFDDPFTLPIWSALNGAQLYDAANQQYTIDAEANVAMMEYLVSWLDEEYQGDISKVNRSGAWAAYPGEDGQPPAFQSGRLAMTENGSWLMGDFYATIEPVFEAWDVAPYPVGPGGSEAISGYWPNWIVIPAGSKHVEEMFAYLDFMSVVGVQEWFAVVPDMPTNTQVPAVVPQIVVDKRDEAFAQEIMAFFQAQAEVTTPMWDSPVQSFATDQLNVALESIANKQSSPQDALAEAQQACQAELEKVLQG